MLIAVTKHSDLHPHYIHAKVTGQVQTYKAEVEVKDKQLKAYAVWMRVLLVAIWTVVKSATVHFLKTQLVICYLCSLPCLSRLWSSGFCASDGISQVFPLSTDPLILLSLQSLETRLLVIFHFSAISDVVRNSIYYPLKMLYLISECILLENNALVISSLTLIAHHPLFYKALSLIKV